MSGLSNQAKAEICKITCGRYPIRHSKDCPWNQASLSPEQSELESLRAENRRLKIEIAVLTSTPTGQDIVTAYKQTEAALGEAVELIKYVAEINPLMYDDAKTARECAEEFLQNPTAKAAGERWGAMERVVEVAKKAYEFLEIRALGGDITDELEDALAAYEEVKGE